MDRASIGTPNQLVAGVPAVRAGDFVFLSSGIAPGATDDPLRFPLEQQTGAIFEQLSSTLEEAGSSMNRVVKLQTFHCDLDEFPTHLAARKRAFSPPLPPSTAMEAHLPHPDADISINAIALAGDTMPEPVEVDSVPRPLGPYSQAVKAPPFVFLAGVLASDFKTGVAPEARVPQELPYFGSPIKAQTAFVLETIGKILEGAGSSLDSVMKAQVILTDMSDFFGFEEVWRSFFPDVPPARSVIQAGLVNPGCIVEVDVIALTTESGLEKEAVGSEEVPISPLAESQAIRAGEWLFFGSQLATDYATGVAPSARIDPNFPRYDTPIRRQGNQIIDNIGNLLATAGSSLDRLVNLWVFVDGGMDEFLGVRQVIEEALTDHPPAVTTTGTGGLYVPGCVVAIDGVAVIDT